MNYNIDTAADMLATTVWLLFFIYLAAGIIRNTVRLGLSQALRRILSIRTIAFLLLPVVITLIAMSLVFIEPPNIGVVISIIQPRGYREQPLESGLHWIIPISERVEVYPVYQQTYTMSSNPMDGNRPGNDTIRARTSDGQEVSIDTSIIFAVNAEQVIRLHIQWQHRYIEDLIRPLIRGVVRSRVASFTVSEVNSIKRQDLEATLSEELTEELSRHGLIVDKFLVRNIAFSPEYAASVEQKQVALEEATQSEYEAERIRRLASGRADEITALADAQAGALLIEAQAQAEALRLVSDVIQQNDDLLTYRYIDKLSPGIQVMLLPSNAPFILPLPGSQNFSQMMAPDTEDDLSETAGIDSDVLITPEQLADILGTTPEPSTP